MGPGGDAYGDDPELDAAAFTAGYTPEDRLRAYGIFGGLPGHLALLDAADEPPSDEELDAWVITARRLELPGVDRLR